MAVLCFENVENWSEQSAYVFFVYLSSTVVLVHIDFLLYYSLLEVKVKVDNSGHNICVAVYLKFNRVFHIPHYDNNNFYTARSAGQKGCVNMPLLGEEGPLEIRAVIGRHGS